MAIEIERKFLCRALSPHHTLSGTKITQGYLRFGDPELRVRREVYPNQMTEWTLTAKSGTGLVRTEEESDLRGTLSGIAILELCSDHVIEKTRYCLAGGWEIDVYERGLLGLCVAEIELPTENAPLPHFPDCDGTFFLGPEVTGNRSYSNQRLAAMSHREAVYFSQRSWAFVEEHLAGLQEEVED